MCFSIMMWEMSEDKCDETLILSAHESMVGKDSTEATNALGFANDLARLPDIRDPSDSGCSYQNPLPRISRHSAKAGLVDIM